MKNFELHKKNKKRQSSPVGCESACCVPGLARLLNGDV
jgi:hypothetical protein